jgi:hypothetical protein
LKKWGGGGCKYVHLHILQDHSGLQMYIKLMNISRIISISLVYV